MTGQHAAADRWLHAVPAGPPTADGRRPAPDPLPALPGLLDAPVTFGSTSREAGAESRAHDLTSHLATYGSRPDASGRHAADLVAALEEVALTGRGGGHFRVARKWRTALAAGGGGTVVANCAEGEPASAKDAALLQLRPHLVLDGMALAAEALGTREAIVWLHKGDHATRVAVVRALAERHAQGDLTVAVRVVEGPDHYLTGESSSVVRALSGGPALPYLTRQPSAVHGIGGRPTLLHNAETLARIALVARRGGGVPLEAPLLTVVGRGRRIVTPARVGETLGDVVARSGVVADPNGSVLLGGYGGTWLPWAHVLRVEATEDAFRPLGASLGAGVVAPLGAYECGLAETSRVLDYLAASSARQCGPCLFGLPAMATLLQRLAAGRTGRGDLRTLERYAAEVSGRGACHHPDGAVQLVRSALRTFAADVRRHQHDGPCPGVDERPLLPLPEVF
jgi:NADH:ubiquinone oxidoreductase subunit F (NADH-binding)